MEKYEIHRELFNLPRFVFPICLLCLGYPTKSQIERPLTSRFAPQFIVFENQYQSLDPVQQKIMFQGLHADIFKGQTDIGGAQNIGQLTYRRKFGADFTLELNRSVKAILQRWTRG